MSDSKVNSDSSQQDDKNQLAGPEKAPERATEDAPVAETIRADFLPLPSQSSMSETEAGSEPFPEIAGYDILEELGRGGMGVVFKARQLEPNLLVALKMIGGRFLTPSEEVRFRNEAEVIGKLRHRNIVQIYDYAIGDGHPYFSMELLDGGSLSDRMKTTRWSGKDVARLIEKLARAIHHAHDQGIVHRDIKPDNILFTQDGEPQLTDFGLAHRDDCDFLETTAGTQMGTLPYMSPEQARGDSHRVDARSDVWSLGAVLYELLSGRRPFSAENRGEVHRQVLEEDPLPISSIRRGIDKDLSTICQKCLSKVPADRYASASALGEDLRAYLEHRPITARPVSVVLRLRKWIRRRPVMAIALAGIVIAMAGCAFGFWYYDAFAAERVSYFGSADTRWGIPIGVHEITRKELRRRGWGVELTRFGRKGQPHLVRVVNNTGEPMDGILTTWFDGLFGPESEINWSQTKYRYDEFGRIASEYAFNQDDAPVYSMNYYYAETAGIDSTPAEASARYFRADGTEFNSLPVALIKFFLDSVGRTTEVHFLDPHDGTPRKNFEQVYGYRILYDRHGLPRQYTCLDSDLKRPLECRYQFAIKSIVRTPDGDIAETVYRDRNRKVVLSAFGFAISKTSLDGRIRRLRYFDVDGTTPAEHLTDGFGADLVLDSTGNVIDYYNVDANGRRLPED